MAVLLVGLAACAEFTTWEPGTPHAPPSGNVHVVQSGETLYKIAFRYRLDWRDLANWNRLSNADRIHPGQRIRLTPPAGVATAARQQPAARVGRAPAATAAPPAPAVRRAAGPQPEWRWPVEGPLLWSFGQSRRNPTGIGLGGADGQEVHAAADGDVVYSGSGLIGYGQLIILKHNDTYLSAYGHNQTLRVAEGERVTSGEVIALMGRGPGDRPLLHFEIRLEGKPVDPVRYLPAR